MKKLFDIVNPKFFSILSSPNKEFYCECLFKLSEIIDSAESDFETKKEDIVRSLCIFFENSNNMKDTIINEDGETYKTLNEKASFVLRKLKDCGWIGEEELGDYKVSLHFYDYSFIMLEALEKICYGDADNYSRDIFDIYSIIDNFETDDPIDVIELTYKKTKDLIKRLQNIKGNIYRYYHDLLVNKNDVELKKLLEDLLLDYKMNFFDKSYYNLKTSDSYYRHKRHILIKIKQIADNEILIDEIASRALKDGKFNDYNDAYYHYQGLVDFVFNSFTKLDFLMEQIEVKNEQYINAMTQKILFLTNDSSNIKGILSRFLKALISDEITFDVVSQYFNLNFFKNLDMDSLYKPRLYVDHATMNELINYTEEEKEWLIRSKISSIIDKTKYNIDNINSFAENLLLSVDELEAKDVLLQTDDDYIRLILLFVYSRSTNANYECISKDEFVTNNFAYFKNFIIRRRIYE